jgi:hypothetical protein
VPPEVARGGLACDLLRNPGDFGNTVTIRGVDADVPPQPADGRKKEGTRSLMPDYTPTPTTIALKNLHDEYVEAVNIAVAEDRDDLVEELVASYPDAALRLLTEQERPAA